MPNSSRRRAGSLSLRTVAMPADTNPNGDIFGGWIMSLMDLAAGVAAGTRAKGRVATAAVSNLSFLQPVKVGDVVCVYTEITQDRADLDDRRRRGLCAAAQPGGAGAGDGGGVRAGGGGRPREAAGVTPGLTRSAGFRAWGRRSSSSAGRAGVRRRG